jgi:hypothetical protein
MSFYENNQGVVLWLLIVFVLPPAYYLIQVARRRREVIQFKLKRLAVYFVCVVTGMAVIPGRGYSTRDAAIFSFFFGISAALVLVRRRRTSRRVPNSLRRIVIAKYEATGKRFDPRLHELDHIVPFSKGGDHSEQNLRVVNRSANRSRGAKMPRFRDFI